jgi:hypothetical protein
MNLLFGLGVIFQLKWVLMLELNRPNKKTL